MSHRPAFGAFAILLLLGASASYLPETDAKFDENEGGDAVLDVGALLEKSDGSVEVVAVDDPRLPRAFRREWVPSNAPNQGLAPLCNADGNPLSGWWYTLTVRDKFGAIVSGPEPVCVPLPDPAAPSIPPPPVLAEPPSTGQLWSAAAATIPKPVISVSPTTDGVTGLETWLWADSADSGTVSVTATVDAWTITGTATRTGYSWDFGVGHSGKTTTDTGGSEAAPAARYTYETKGPYVLRVSTTWTGQFTLTGPGITTPIPVGLGTARLTSTRDYRVVEIRSVLVR